MELRQSVCPRNVWDGVGETRHHLTSTDLSRSRLLFPDVVQDMNRPSHPFQSSMVTVQKPMRSGRAAVVVSWQIWDQRPWSG